ncbi:MAG: hypothetical protein JST09_04010 [Bacteroidetes bacterium]|nr:hypothetical protein [Bacteroidota bacterium]MBS1610816.1 hypothetical protein [Bacteroidota bacterium]
MEFYLTAYSYLKGRGLNINRKFLRIRMQSHPDYPSLISLTDSLDELGISFNAIQAEKKLYRDLQYPLLAHIVNSQTVEFKQIESALFFEKNRDVFEHWNGIVFSTEHSGRLIFNKEYSSFEEKKKRFTVYCYLFFFYFLHFI